MKRKFLVVFLVAFFGGFFHAIAYVNPYEGEILLSELVLQLSGSRGKLPMGTAISELVSFMLRMFPYYLFEMYFGIMIFRHFCTASVYVFSRCTDRLNWYFHEVIEIGTVTVVYQFLQCGITIFIAMIRYHVRFDQAGVFLWMYHVAIYILWVCTITLCVNLLAIKVGSNTAFTGVMIVQAVFIVLIGIITSIKPYFVKKFCLNLNPISHLILGWQNSKMENLRQVLNPPYSGLNMKFSLLYMIVFFIVVTLVGVFIITKHDLLLNDAEMGE